MRKIIVDGAFGKKLARFRSNADIVGRHRVAIAGLRVRPALQDWADASADPCATVHLRHNKVFPIGCTAWIAAGWRYAWSASTTTRTFTARTSVRPADAPAAPAAAVPKICARDASLIYRQKWAAVAIGGPAGGCRARFTTAFHIPPRRFRGKRQQSH